MTSEQISSLAAWARSHDAIVSLWLFGSRARNTHRPDSDHDIAVQLAPKKDDHDWAFGDYVFKAKEWKSQIRAILETDISLVAFRDDIEMPFDPRVEGIRLWERQSLSL